MILFVGLLSDPTIVHTMGVCQRKGIDFTFFDTGKFISEGNYEWNSDTGEGTLDNGDIHLSLSERRFSGVYARLIYFPQKETAASTVRMQLLMDVVNSLKVPTVVNTPFADQSNRAKMYHLSLLRKCGFLVPRSLLTTRKKDALNFIESHSSVIYKGSSSEKTIVSLYSSDLACQLDLLENSPVLFQEYIKGVDIRTHLVGSQFFSEEINSEGIDYRFQKETNTFRMTEIPPSLKEKCMCYQELSGLSFIGFDFKRTATGQYYIMEANPMPGYDSYDRRLDLKISEALIDLLRS